jgi:uncharacterized membrane protein SpoIIM required for sporulation
MLDPAPMLWAAAGLLIALAVVAAWAEHRRQRRRDVDRPGFVPWNAIQIFAFLLSVVAAMLAVKAG